MCVTLYSGRLQGLDVAPERISASQGLHDDETIWHISLAWSYQYKMGAKHQTMHDWSRTNYHEHENKTSFHMYNVPSDRKFAAYNCQPFPTPRNMNVWYPWSLEHSSVTQWMFNLYTLKIIKEYKLQNESPLDTVSITRSVDHDVSTERRGVRYVLKYTCCKNRYLTGTSVVIC